MSLAARRAIVIILILAFAISAPLVIMRTAGYRYNWKKGRPEMTGVIKFDSKPNGAAVSLNGSPQGVDTPTSVFRLLPGEYEISLSKPGYFPWSKTLAVKSGETTFIDTVVLVARSPAEIVRPGGFTTAAFSPDGEIVAGLSASGDKLDLIVTGTDGKTETVLGSFAADDLADAALTWSSSADWLLFSDRLPNGSRRLRTYALYGGVQPTPVNDLLPPRARVITANWAADDERLVIVTNAGVYLHDPATGGTRSILTASGITDAAVTKGHGYALRPAGGTTALERFTLTGVNTPATLFSLPTENYVFSEIGAYFLLLTDAETGQSYLYDLNNEQPSGPLSGEHAAWQKSGQRGRILFWNDFEIYSFDPSAGYQELITRVGTPIINCAWQAAGRLVYYATATGITAIETDARDRRNAYPLVRDAEIMAADLANNGRSMFFAGRYDGQAGLFTVEP